MSDIVDVETLVGNIKTYDGPAGSDVERVGHTDDNLPDTLIRLIYRMERRDVSPDKCAFYLHPETQRQLVDEIEEHTHTPGGYHRYNGRPIKTHPGIPKDTVLFLAPDAVALGGKVYNPRPIAYVELEATDAE